MSKSSKCLPTIRCLNRNKTSSEVKIKSSARMPTIREFITSHNNAGTQTSICQNESVRMNDWTSIGSKSSTPRFYRSTIAVKSEKSFVPLSAAESLRNEIFSKQPVSDASIISQVSKVNEKSNTVFMSESSFDSLFDEFNEKNREKESKEKNLEGKKEETDRSVGKVNGPFVVSEYRRPKVVAVTPSNRKRSANSRPLVKITFQPLLPRIRDMESGIKSDSSLDIRESFR